MKSFASRLVVLSLVSLTASLGFAQTNKTQKTRSQRVPAEVAAPAPAPAASSRARAAQNDTWSWVKARTTVGGFISSASDLSVSGASLTIPQGNQTFRGGGSMSTSTALGVTAQLIEMKTPNWGWFAAGSIEQTREIGSVNLNLGQARMQGTLSNKPNFRPLILSGGAVYRFNDAIYASGGVNYTIYRDFGGGDLSSASLDPKIGYQYGVGFKPVPRLALEIMHRDVRYSMSGNFNGNNRLNLDDVRLIGLNIIGRYELE